MKEVNTKDIRKIAFAIGFGLTLGKLTASALNTVINSGIRGLTVSYTHLTLPTKA